MPPACVGHAADRVEVTAAPRDDGAGGVADELGRLDVSVGARRPAPDPVPAHGRAGPAAAANPQQQGVATSDGHGEHRLVTGSAGVAARNPAVRLPLLLSVDLPDLVVVSRAIDRDERATEEYRRTGSRQGQGADPAIGARRPAIWLAGGKRKPGDVRAGGRVDALEVAAGIQPPGADEQGVDVAARICGEAADQHAVARADGCDVPRRPTVDLGELPTQVHRLWRR